jgi:hypothetical protein
VDIEAGPVPAKVRRLGGLVAFPKLNNICRVKAYHRTYAHDFIAKNTALGVEQSRKYIASYTRLVCEGRLLYKMLLYVGLKAFSESVFVAHVATPYG